MIKYADLFKKEKEAYLRDPKILISNFVKMVNNFLLYLENLIKI